MGTSKERRTSQSIYWCQSNSDHLLELLAPSTTTYTFSIAIELLMVIMLCQSCMIKHGTINQIEVRRVKKWVSWLCKPMKKVLELTRNHTKPRGHSGTLSRPAVRTQCCADLASEDPLLRYPNANVAHSFAYYSFLAIRVSLFRPHVSPAQQSSASRLDSSVIPNNGHSHSSLCPPLGSRLRSSPPGVCGLPASVPHSSSPCCGCGPAPQPI